MSSAASSALAQAQQSYVRWRRDAMQHLKTAQQHDPDYAMAHAVEGLFMHMARDVSHRPAIEAALTRAQASVGDDPIERQYVAALEAASKGELTRMVCCFEQVLMQNPTDVFALRMCQGELFWLGEMQWSASISGSVEPHWNDSHPQYGSYLSVRAFDLEETGQYQQAERCGRQAVEIDPTDPWGTHAVAHVMFMQGRFEDGAKWLDGLRGNWEALSQIKLHLWWHRALFAVEQGDLAGALQIYDDYVRNLELDMIVDLPDLYIDLQNAASLLMRLELLGHDVQSRWQELGEIASKRKHDHSNPFTSAHFALMLAAAGRTEEVPALLDSMREWAVDDGTLAPRIAAAALPSAMAAVAHRKGDHEQVVNWLMPARRALWQMGGSHAQRELFFLLLADSLRKLGRHSDMQMVQRDIEAAGFADSMVQRFN
jgi:tetratricopeptide (TPR) repeat protein